MHNLDAAPAAFDLLRDPEVARHLNLDSADATRLGLALVDDAEAGSSFARGLLAQHANRVAALERQERCSSARPERDDRGEVVISYELSGPTRRCLELVAALRKLGGTQASADRAA